MYSSFVIFISEEFLLLFVSLVYLVRRGCLVETKRTGQIFLPFSLSVCTL